MNCLSRPQQRQILTLMCRNNGIRDIVEITGHSPNAVKRYLARFGEALRTFHNEVRNLKLTYRLEIDEIWSYVYAKEYNAKKCKFPRRYKPDHVGNAYTWTAYDPDNKLLVSAVVGDRGIQAARMFLADVRARIVNSVVITTDGYRLYPRAIDDVFGTEADHVILKKLTAGYYTIENRNAEMIIYGIKKYLRQPKRKRAHAVDLDRASTSRVERQNASIRNYISRFNRKTYRFSKKLANHFHAQSIYLAYYNFVKEHFGMKGADRHLTPAMKAVITNKIWTYDDLLDEVDGYWERKLAQPNSRAIKERPQYIPIPEGKASDKLYFVSFDPVKPHAKLHLGTCRNCQRGRGRRPDVQKRTTWYDFDTKEAALKCAKVLAPGDNSECALCLTGRYRRRG